MFKLDKDWFGILSEFFVNISAGWFAIVFIEPQIAPVEIVPLTFRVFLGIVSLFIAKYFKKKER